MNNTTNNQVVLKVENLSQHFKMGRIVNKAVNDVSFEIKKGEVFGLVGESGCGKTTTGRTIIKLYDAIGGNVWLNGQRVVAGSLQYRQNINIAKKSFEKEMLEFKNSNPSSEELLAKTQSRKAELDAYIAEQKELIRIAKLDHVNSDKNYRANCVKKVEDEFNPKVEELTKKFEESQSPEDKEALDALLKEKNEALRVAKKERLVTKIQMIFQDPIGSLNPRMTVREIIAEGMIIKGIRNKKYINERVYEMLNLVGLLPEHADRYPHEFSGGQRQRVGIARAIVLNPELLIADEPISALDVSIQAQVITLLNDLREKIGLTILFIAHNISVVKYFCDTIAIMYGGKIMEKASTQEIFDCPLHPYTKALLSAVPYPDPLFEKSRQRILYNPIIEHPDYRENPPSMREIREGHFIFCNDREFANYQEILKNNA